MPLIPHPGAVIPAAAAGFCTGAAVMAAVAAVIRRRLDQARRVTLGHAALKVEQALTALEYDGELNYGHMRTVGDIRAMAEKVALLARR